MKRNITCIDLETTEVDKQRARIVQLAATTFDPETGKIIDDIVWYIKPTGSWHISESASEVNGLTDEFIEKKGHDLIDVAPILKKMIEGNDILTHNGTMFDIVILEREMERVRFDLGLEKHEYIDTCDIERRTHSSKLTDTYKRYYGEDFEDAHDALADVHATIAVYKAQMKRIDPLLIEESNKTNSDILKTSPEGFVKHDEDGQLVFNLGKYRGKTTNEVCASDPNYIKWVFGINNTTGERNTTIPTQKAIQSEWFKYKASLNTKTNSK